MRVDGRTRVLAVLGDPVSHSLSPVMHNSAIRVLGLDAVYVALRVPPAALEAVTAAIRAVGMAGNATLPLKERLAELVDRRTAACERCGACNTFWTEEGLLVGDNTDVAGVTAVLEAVGADGGTWLVLGTGGSARAVAVAAEAHGASLRVRSRTPERAQRFARWAESLGLDASPWRDGEPVQVVVNATPLGLAREDALPIEPRAVPACRVAVDLVYAPGGSRWAAAMAARGASAVDGRAMLIAQGIASFERFFPGHRAPREVMRWAVDRALDR